MTQFVRSLAIAAVVCVNFQPSMQVSLLLSRFGEVMDMFYDCREGIKEGLTVKQQGAVQKCFNQALQDEKANDVIYKPLWKIYEEVGGDTIMSSEKLAKFKQYERDYFANIRLTKFMIVFGRCLEHVRGRFGDIETADVDAIVENTVKMEEADRCPAAFGPLVRDGKYDWKDKFCSLEVKNVCFFKECIILKPEQKPACFYN